MSLLLMIALLQEAQVDARKTIERSLPYLEKKGVEWMENRKCASCHHVTFMVWSHREALARGFAVDEKKLEAWTKWLVEFTLTSKTKEGRRNGGGLDTMAQTILARPTEADPAPYRELAGMIAAEQKPEGHWESGGQLLVQRRPKPETMEASTLWVLHALGSMGEEAGREKALAWLRERRPGKSTESLALHWLTTRSDDLLKELLAAQHEDGGWGFLRGEASDALGTGVALYVLSDAPSAGSAIGRARKLLARTQLQDGSWKVPTTKTSSKEFSIPEYWGTAWATLGLLRTLPRGE